MPDSIRFTVSGLGTSVKMTATSNVHPIHGETKGVDGFVEITLDDSGAIALDPSPQAEIELKVESVSTGNALYDNEIARRLEVRKFPRIVGRLTAVERIDPERFRVRGDLSFHGVTQPVDTEMTVKVANGRLEAEWEQAVDIREFNLTAPKVLGFKVDPIVKVDCRVTADG